MLYRTMRTMISIGLIAILSTNVCLAMTDEEVDKLFNEALEQSELGDLAKSIALFETILSERPTLNRVRIELALSNFRALNYLAAKSLAEEVLNNPETPEAVKDTIRTFLEQVQNKSKKHVWTPYASIGYIHDDNVNVGPGTDTIDIGGATLTLNAASTPKSSGGVQVNAGIGHRYLAPSTYKIAGNQAALAWQSNLSLFRNQYIDESAFNLNVISVSTGPAILVARKWRAQLKAQVDQVSLGNNSLAWYTGLTPSLSWYFSKGSSLTASFQAQDRDYTSSANQDRDALFLSAGLSLGHRFDVAHKPTLSIGTKIFSSNAETERRSNDGFALNAGFSMEPGKNSNLYANYNWRNRDYDGDEPIFAVARDEIERRFSVGGSYRLETDNFLNDLKINLSHTHTKNSSNVAIFEYTRQQTVLSVSRSF